MLKKMLKTVRYESIAIGLVIEQIWRDCIFTRSLVPVFRLLDPKGKYEIGDEIRTGNYYTFVRDMMHSGYYPTKGGG